MGNSTMGLNLYEGHVDCMKSLGVTVMGRVCVVSVGTLISIVKSINVAKFCIFYTIAKFIA